MSETITNTGWVIFDTDTKEFYEGFKNHFNKQLRHAKIYRSKQWTKDIMEYHKDRNLILVETTISTEIPTTGD